MQGFIIVFCVCCCLHLCIWVKNCCR